MMLKIGVEGDKRCLESFALNAQLNQRKRSASILIDKVSHKDMKEPKSTLGQLRFGIELHQIQQIILGDWCDLTKIGNPIRD